VPVPPALVDLKETALASTGDKTMEERKDGDEGEEGDEQTKVQNRNDKESSNEESGEEDETDRSLVDLNDECLLDGIEFSKKEKEAYAKVKEEWKELTHYERWIRLPAVLLKEQYQTPREEAFDLDQENFGTTLASASATISMDTIPSLWMQYTVLPYRLPPQIICNLVYQPDQFATWIVDLNLKTHDELEQKKQAPLQIDDEDTFI